MSKLRILSLGIGLFIFTLTLTAGFVVGSYGEACAYCQHCNCSNCGTGPGRWDQYGHCVNAYCWWDNWQNERCDYWCPGPPTN